MRRISNKIDHLSSFILYTIFAISYDIDCQYQCQCRYICHSVAVDQSDGDFGLEKHRQRRTDLEKNRSREEVCVGRESSRKVHRGESRQQEDDIKISVSACTRISQLSQNGCQYARHLRLTSPTWKSLNITAVIYSILRRMRGIPHPSIVST